MKQKDIAALLDEPACAPNTKGKFGLRPLVLPDIGDSLDSHLPETDYRPLTIGGTLTSELPTLGDALATLFDLANILLGLEKGEIHPHRSRLKQWPEAKRTAAAH